MKDENQRTQPPSPTERTIQAIRDDERAKIVRELHDRASISTSKIERAWCRELAVWIEERGVQS